MMGPKETTLAVEIKDVSFAYDETLALENVSLSVQEGDFLGVIGPNGSGKTTLLKIILGFLKPQQGTVSVLRQPPQEMRSRIGYVPQHSHRDKDFPILTEEVVAMGVTSDRVWWPWISKQTMTVADEAMDAVSLSDLKGRTFGSLSYGQKQRCFIARALAAHPKILLLDEPTANVDSKIEKDIFALLKKLNEHMTIILVSHDIGFVSSFVTKVACVNRKLTCHPIEEMSNDIIDQCYHAGMTMIHHKCDL